MHARRLVYLAAAALALFLAVWAWADSGTYVAWLPYFALTAICILQFFKPMVALWWVVFAVFAVASAFYSWLFLRDLWYLATDRSTQVLLDGSDSVAFVFYLFAVLAVTFCLLRIRPTATSRSAT
jgi:hypothetical protein